MKEIMKRQLNAVYGRLGNRVPWVHRHRRLMTWLALGMFVLGACLCYWSHDLVGTWVGWGGALVMVVLMIRGMCKGWFSLVLAGCVIAGPVQAQETTKVPSGGGNQPEQVMKCNAMIEIVAGAAIVYLLYSVYVCAKHTVGPSGDPQPQPPSPPTPPPPPTNNPPPVFPPVIGPILVVTNDDSQAEQLWPVSGNGWTDWQGYPYTWGFSTITTTNGLHLQTTTNCLQWTDVQLSVTGYVSSVTAPDLDMSQVTNVCYVVYDAGVPVLTNWCAAGGLSVAELPMRDALRLYRTVMP